MLVDFVPRVFMNVQSFPTAFQLGKSCVKVTPPYTEPAATF